MAKKPTRLDRRTFLRGAGVACALPLLDCMRLPAASMLGTGAVEDPKVRQRMCFVYFPNGASMPGAEHKDDGKWNWFPRGEGRDYEFTEVLRPLEAYRSKLTMKSGLSHPMSRELLGHLAGDTWLTAGDVRGDVYKNRVSADQVAALQFKKHTRYPSLVLSTDGGVGYKSRVSTLSFDHTGRPIPSENKQRLIFERYFAQGGSTDERRKSLQQGRKIVDLVLEDSRRLPRSARQARPEQAG